MNVVPAGSQSQGSTENLAGLVEHVTYHSEENGFCVLRLKTRGQRDLITVTGHAAMISAGEFVQAAGSWNNDRTQTRRGLQHGHHLRIEHVDERVWAPPAAKRGTSGGQSRDPDDPMSGRLAHRRLGGRDGHGVGLTMLHAEPHLVIGHVAAGGTGISLLNEEGRPQCRPATIIIN